MSLSPRSPPVPRPGVHHRGLGRGAQPAVAQADRPAHPRVPALRGAGGRAIPAERLLAGLTLVPPSAAIARAFLPHGPGTTAPGTRALGRPAGHARHTRLLAKAGGSGPAKLVAASIAAGCVAAGGVAAAHLHGAHPAAATRHVQAAPAARPARSPRSCPGRRPSRCVMPGLPPARPPRRPPGLRPLLRRAARRKGSPPGRSAEPRRPWPGQGRRGTTPGLRRPREASAAREVFVSCL